MIRLSRLCVDYFFRFSDFQYMKIYKIKLSQLNGFKSAGEEIHRINWIELFGQGGSLCGVLQWNTFCVYVRIEFNEERKEINRHCHCMLIAQSVLRLGLCSKFLNEKMIKFAIYETFLRSTVHKQSETKIVCHCFLQPDKKKLQNR